MRALPIRMRLTLWYCVTFVIAAAMLSGCSVWMLGRSLVATEDHELQERAGDVQQVLTDLGAAADAKVVQDTLRALFQGKDEGKYLQVADGQGHWIYRSKRMMDEGLRLPSAADLPAQGTALEFHQGPRFVRTVAYPIHANGRLYVVQTGLTLNKSMVLLAAFRTQLLLLTPAVLVLAGLGGHFMSRRALAPVAAIATEARRINDKNLDIRLPVGDTQDEISHLSETLNQMLARVEVGVRSIREFTANAAHELRTPLALIRTEVEVALSLPRTAHVYREACEQVQLESVRMTALIDNLLMLARVEADTEGFRQELIEGNQLIGRVGEKWKHSMRLAMLNFYVNTTRDPLFTTGDSESLQRLLTILLDNAVRYTPPGGAVTLEVTEQDGRITFCVRDTGLGIAAEHQERVFERFYRVDRKRGGLAGGSGLGLALAKWIAEKHGTRVLLQSELGKGAAFSFSLEQDAALSGYLRVQDRTLQG